MLAYVRMFNWLCDCELAYNPHLAGRREHSSDERPLSPTGFWRRPAQSIRPGSTICIMRAGAGRFTPITVTGIARFHCRRKPIFPSCGRLTASPDKMPFFVTEGNLFPGWPSLYPKWGNSPRNPAWRGLYGPYAVREISALDLGAAAYYLPADERAIRPAHIRSLITQAALCVITERSVT